MMPRPGHPAAWKREWLVLGVGLLLIGGAVGLSVLRDAEEVDRRERERLAAQTGVVVDLLAHQLEAASETLRSILAEFPQWQQHGNLERVGRDHLRALDLAMPTIRTILVTDAAGTVVTSNRGELIGRNYAGRDYFQTPRDHPDAGVLYLSPPFRTTLGAWTFNLTRARLGPGGAFEGVVTAAVELEELKVVLGAIRYAPDMRVSLLFANGTLFVTVPQSESRDGMNLSAPGTLFSRFKASGGDAMVQSGRFASTGDLRMVAHRMLRPTGVHGDEGLVIAASRGLGALHAGARADAGRAALLFGLLVAGSVSALALLQVRRRRGAALVEQADALARDARDELERFFSITPDMLCVADLEGRFRRLNPAWEAVLGRPLGDLEGASFMDLVHPEDAAETTGTMGRLAAGEAVIDFTNRLRRADGDWRFVQWRAASKGPFIFAAARDVTERHLAAAQALASLRDNERLVAELQEALQNVKTLAGMLPICMYCHRIRNDAGYWDRIEQYISAHSDATFSHGMCPTCYERQFPPGVP